MKTAFPPAQMAASQRWDLIDVARSLAILAMILYHFSWDLSFLGLIETNILAVPAWRWFARAIAASFLVLAGYGLVLAHLQGFRPRPFFKRLLKVGGAALAVTLVTWLAFPESYIFFGILHCIAVSSVLALPFLRLPAVVIGPVALLCLAAPFAFTSPALDAPWLDWLGLGEAVPLTNDYVPILPWFGFVLIGIAAGKILLSTAVAPALGRWRAKGTASRMLVWAGRKSLPIYLIHQPVLLAILYGVLQIVGPSPAAEARPFMLQCEANCLQTMQPQTCKAVCGCTVDALRQTDLWRKILDYTVSAEDQTRISRTAQQCLRRPPA